MTISPPLYFSFQDREHAVRALEAALNVSETEALLRLSNRGLPPITSLHSLSVLTGYSPKFLGAIYANPHRYYRTFTIQSGKKYRTISTPRVALKLIQQWFGYHLSRAITWPEFVHGFVPGRSTISAAAVHCNARWVLSMDIRDFFRSTSQFRVSRALESLGYNPESIAILSTLTCLAGGLPQGAPSSPMLSNLCAAQLDDVLASIASSTHSRYTRYADDITFSGTDDYPDDLSARIETAICANGWLPAHEKTGIAKSPDPLRVLGLLVDRSTPRLSRKYLHKLRAMRHVLKTHDTVNKRAKFMGHLAYLHSIDRSSI